MTVSKLNLDDRLLETSATKIERKLDEFIREYEKIYTAAEDLQIKYQGETSGTFNQRILSYKKNFQQAEKDLKEYVKFIREYAKVIDRNENSIKLKAQTLNSF